MDVQLRCMLRPVRSQYGWRFALAGDNTHHQIAIPTLDRGINSVAFSFHDASLAAQRFVESSWTNA
jgi:hypothetical protein